MVSFFLRFYLGASVTLILCLTLAGAYFENQYERTLKQEHVRIAQALKVILDGQICTQPEEDWISIVEQTSKDYSYNIRLLRSSDIEPTHRAQLKLNNAYVSVESGLFKDEILIDYNSRCSDRVLRFAPNSEYNDFYNVILGVTLAFILISLAIAVLLLAWPVIRHINSMLKSMYAIANGDFSVRANEAAPAPLDKLACAINFVAKQIDNIISEQQMLTNAASHELNTPLMRISYALELALKSPKSDLDKEHLKMMEEDLLQLQNLVQEILNYSKFRFGDTSICKTSVKVLDLFNRVKSEVQLIRPEIEIEVVCDEATSMVVCQKDMHRAMSNLVRNAQKYATHMIKMEARFIDHSLCLFVVDDGCGIPDEQKENVLKPFYRIDPSRNRETGGAGLGLAIARRICQLHLAQLTLLDNEYGGLAVRITLDAETC